MVNRNTKQLEKDLEEGFKEVLLKMESEEFTEYFKHLIKKYYDVLFTFENDYSKYYEDSNNQYETTIQLVKDLTGFKYKNLDNFENFERLKQAEEIAFNQMNTIHFLEENYSNLIYSYTTKELIYINGTLSSLIELYETNPSEELLAVIEDRFNSTLDIIKEAKKLPVHEGNISDYTETYTVKKEHFKANERPEEDVEGIAFSVPIFSLFLSKLLKRFFSLVEDLKKILPSDVIENYFYNLEYPEKLEYLNSLIDSGVEEEEAIEVVAFLGYAKKKNNSHKYLYELLEEWS